MLDEVKKQKIIELINTSNILTIQEKTDWLALLDLMNDKQIAELEEILLPSKPAQASPVATNNAQPSNASLAMPDYSAKASLSHISNIPSHLTDPRMAKATPKPVLPPQPTSPRPSQTQPIHQPTTRLVSPPVASTKPIPNRAEEMSQSIASKPSARVVPFLGLKSLDDIGNLTASVLHSQNRQSFFAAISELTQSHGYFGVLSSFETSPLYKDYINFGKLKLSGSDQKPEISQEEFEFVTDLLLALKINRV